MKKLKKIKGVVSLSKKEQKEINGARIGCSANCSGRPRGSRCYYGGHCLCPGVCLGGCVPL